MFFILPFSTSLVRRHRRAFFCYFRPAESNGEAAGGALSRPPVPQARVHRGYDVLFQRYGGRDRAYMNIKTISGRALLVRARLL